MRSDSDLVRRYRIMVPSQMLVAQIGTPLSSPPWSQISPLSQAESPIKHKRQTNEVLHRLPP